MITVALLSCTSTKISKSEIKQQEKAITENTVTLNAECIDSENDSIIISSSHEQRHISSIKRGTGEY